MHAREWTSRELWIDSLRSRVEANSAESFNFLCKWGRETGPFLFLSLASIPSRMHRGSRRILFYRSLEEMREPALKKTLNRKCEGEEMLVDDTTSNSRSNWTFGSILRIIINLVNSWKLLLHSINERCYFFGIIRKILRVGKCLLSN